MVSDCEKLCPERVDSGSGVVQEGGALGIGPRSRWVASSRLISSHCIERKHVRHLCIAVGFDVASSCYGASGCYPHMVESTATK